MKKLPWSTILLFRADSFLVEAIDVLLIKGRDALTSFVILEYDRRQRSTLYVQGGRHDVSLHWPPPPPRCQLLTVIKNLLSQHCRGNLLLRIRLVLVFHWVLQLQRANNIQFGEWHFVSVASVWRGIQLWNRTQPNSKNADFFPNSINHGENNIVFEIACFVRVSLLITF